MHRLNKFVNAFSLNSPLILSYFAFTSNLYYFFSFYYYQNFRFLCFLTAHVLNRLKKFVNVSSLNFLLIPWYFAFTSNLYYFFFFLLLLLLLSESSSPLLLDSVRALNKFVNVSSLNSPLIPSYFAFKFI